MAQAMAWAYCADWWAWLNDGWGNHVSRNDRGF